MKPRGLSQGPSAAALVGPVERARAVGRSDILRLGSNESPFGPSPRAMQAMREEIVRANRYGDPSLYDLRGALASAHGVSRDNVLVAAGIDDLIGLTVRAFLDPGGAAIASLGQFPTFEMHVAGFQGRLETVPYLASGRIDLDGCLAAARRRPRALVFFPNPDNPTGSTYAWDQVRAFVDALPGESLVIHDEAYANFLPDDRRFPDDALDPRIVRMRTFSKEYGLAGMRVGYALAPAETIRALDALRLAYGVNRLAEVAAAAALGDALWVRDVVRRVAEGRAAYAQMGARLGLPVLPSDTNFVLFDLGSPRRAADTVLELLRRGIHVRKPPHPPLDRYVRISVGTPEERVTLEATLAAALAALR